jgi:hypothetical protein
VILVLILLTRIARSIELPLAKIAICAGLNVYAVRTRKYMHQLTELFIGMKHMEFVRQEAYIMRMPWFRDGIFNT